MTKLSPAAQAVLDAAMQHSGPAFEPVVCKMVAAALLVAADQVVPEQKPWHRTGLPGSTRHDVRAEFRAIADELEALPNG